MKPHPGRRNAVRRIAPAAGVLVMIAMSAMGACSPPGGGLGPGASGAAASVQTVTLGTAADSAGPALAVPGARRGGTAIDLEENGLDHLDPAQVYVNREQAISSLFVRTLTGYKVDPKTGRTALVGDLATDTGEPSDGGRTWTYHLKPGLKWQDGEPITSGQVKYGIERLYASFETAGPQYLQSWLSGADYRSAYPGPYSGTSLPNSLVATPNSRTIVFHFRSPHADTPYAMALPAASPILPSKDTKTGYDQHPFSDGPYKIKSYQPGKEMVLARNTFWDPRTDPIRNAYPDEWHIQLGISQPGLTQRLMASADQDKDAVSLVSSADPTQTPTILTGAEYTRRTISQYQPFVDVFNINTSRVKDERVRQAIMYAFPAKQIQIALGGPAQGDLATSLIGPTVTGFTADDPFGKLAEPTGNPAKAKQLLQQTGVKNLKLTYAYANTDRWQNVAVILQKAMAKAGINLQTKAIDTTSYYSLIGKVANSYDIYRSGWAADWPNASTVIPPTQDGRQVSDGSANYSHLQDAYVDSAIDRINKITDLGQQAAQWQQLSAYIMKNLTPEVPYLYDKYFQVYGTGLGGVTYNASLGTINPNTLYVKQ
jgi:peptide/nickel transport system substrate-binding protein